MKLLIFLIILAIIYFIAVNISVIHVESLPEDKKTELLNRSNFRTMLINNSVKDDTTKPKKNDVIEHMQELTTGKKDKYVDSIPETSYHNRFGQSEFLNRAPDLKLSADLPNISKLYMIIKSEYRDEFYKFNRPNLPSVSRYFSSDVRDQVTAQLGQFPAVNNPRKDRLYKLNIAKDIINWNTLFRKYYDDRVNLKLLDINLIFVTETEVEFVLKANLKFLYNNKTAHFEVTYYGQVMKTDDILIGNNEEIIMQLVDIRPIRADDFKAVVRSENEFVTMSDQLAYVDRINKLHFSEAI